MLERGGHTEAAIDLAKLAGLSPVGVLCEITTKDGKDMARCVRSLSWFQLSLSGLASRERRRPYFPIHC